MATTAENIGIEYLDRDLVSISQMVVDSINVAKREFEADRESTRACSLAASAIMESFKEDVEFVVQVGPDSDAKVLHNRPAFGENVVEAFDKTEFVAKNVANIGVISEFINGDEVLIVNGTKFNPISKEDAAQAVA